MRWLALAALLLSATFAQAAEPKCRTLREARAMWPGVYLSWYRDKERRRCWSNSRGRNTARVVRIREGVRAMGTEPAPPPPSMMPLSAAAIDLLAELMRKPPEPPPFPDVSAWDAWIAKIEAAEPAPIYSTFAGEPPDEWPLDERPPGLARIWLLAATLAAAVAVFVGLWQRRAW